ncbi:MAG: hypothetical protein HY730_03780 [Candidatus Tectomicrobia bacterium]|uniref:Uncharacterized protein n=1 Tax=Tectimicrobiota bacterium TaxID=2528274 RepID=A0A933GL82_UNCTE|nr:hypothetical protein [Candidatus Tectomicrobia bacterium]
MTTRRLGSVIVWGLILLWELLYYTGLIDSSRFSHPLGTINALRNLDLLMGLGKTLFRVVLSSLLGVIVGLAIAVLISQNPWVTQTVIRFLRLGLWVPFFIYLAVPYWILPGVVVVSLFACYQFLSIRLALSLPWRESILKVQRGAILQALLFYLVFQFWLPEEWWSLSHGILKVDGVYAIILLLLAFVFFVDRLFRSNFPSLSAMRGAVLVKEIAGGNGSSYWWGVGILIIFCLAVWQLFTDPILRHFKVGSPLAVLETVYPPLGSGALIFDIAVSLLEVFAGLILSGAGAVIVFKGMSDNAHFRNLTFSFVPLTFIVPIMLRSVEGHWVGWDYRSSTSLVVWTALAVGFMTFYPFVLVLWGLRDHPPVRRILLAADEALPYAFLTMLFSEAMAATKGLGFYIIWTRGILEISRSLGASLLTFALLLFISSLLRSAAKRWYFVESTEFRSGIPGT